MKILIRIFAITGVLLFMALEALVLFTAGFYFVLTLAFVRNQ